MERVSRSPPDYLSTLEAGVLAIDPGRAAGWAWYVKGRLMFAGLVLDMANIPCPPVRDVVIEVPTIYQGAGTKADPNDMIQLAIKVGRFVERYDATCEVHTFAPRTWKGQVPKEVHHKRIVEALDYGERRHLDNAIAYTSKSVQHNILDAVGLGLWYVKRTKART